MRVFEILTYVGGAIGMILMGLVLTGANGAPQEAAGAAIAIAFVAIPYCVHGAMYRAAVVDDLDEERRVLEAKRERENGVPDHNGA